MNRREDEIPTEKLMEMAVKVITASASREGSNITATVDMIPDLVAALRKAATDDLDRKPAGG